MSDLMYDALAKRWDLRQILPRLTPKLGPDFDFYDALAFDWPPKRRRRFIYNARFPRGNQ